METVFLLLMPIVAAEEGQPPVEQPPSFLQGMGGFLPIILMIVIFYMILIRPQKRMQRERQAMIASLKKHDQVLTRGGILGTVMDVRPDREEIVVEIAKNTRVRMRRGAVEAVLAREGSETKGD